MEQDSERKAMDRFVNFDLGTASLVPAGDPYDPKQQKFSAARRLCLESISLWPRP